MDERLSCFKAYDVRGIVPSELNSELAYRIGRSLADQTGASNAIIGYDVRLSSKELSEALAGGMQAAGVGITDIGLCGTEMVYFATAKYGFGAGTMITASHNPPEYNGMKMVREESRPISGDSGLWEIEARARKQDFSRSGSGNLVRRDVYDDFADHLLTVVPPSTLKPLRVLCSPGNGCAGLALNAIRNRIPIEIVEHQFEPDGNFPNGVPNPIIEANRQSVVQRMREERFDFGAAWDGDYDRCFFFDENGKFIEGYYIVGLLAEDVLRTQPGAAIVHDPRLVWNTLEIINKHNGRAVCSKSGHAFIKEVMRREDAAYGGEMSAHHYFKSHWYCDSGMIPFLQVARMVSLGERTLGEMISGMESKYPCSGEVNSVVDDVGSAMDRIRKRYADGLLDETDGLSVEFSDWRFNVRSSNTEPVVRLNVESRGSRETVDEKTAEILGLLLA